MSTPTAQANVVAQVYPDVYGINLAENNQKSLFVRRGTIGRDEYYGIRMNEMCFSLKNDMKSSSRHKNPMMNQSNGLVRSALNGLRFDETVEQLIDTLRKMSADPRLIQSIAMRQIQVIGLAFQQAYDHDSSLYGDRKDLNFAVYVSGVILVPVRKQPLAIGDRVRWTVPMPDDYNRRGWFNRKVDQQMIDKIGLYAEPVDPAVDYERTAAGVAAFFTGNSELNAIAREAVDRAPHLLPTVSFPENLKRLVTAAGIQTVYHLIAAGVVEIAGPSRVEGGDAYASANRDGSIESAQGHSVLNFSDALRFVGGAGGALQSPKPGEVAASRVQTFGVPREGVSLLDAATEFAIAMTQLTGLSVSADPPTAARGAQYANEGFYKTSADKTVVERGANKASALFNEVSKSLASTFYRNDDHYKTFPGYNPATGHNDRVFIEGTTVTLDLRRDAGRAANALTEALPAALHSMHDLIEDLNSRGDGVVTRSGAVGSTAEVYFRPG